jgi:uncharacterized protein (TIGR02145 family)
MQTKHLFLLPALAFLACAGLQAQVRIGDNTAPTAGALLDLNSTAKGGLLLSNVTLTNLRTIPTEISEAATINSETDKQAKFTGAIVYHTGENHIPAGVYVWAGERWTPAGSATTVKDTQGHEYSIAKFGAAGTWMTQNLRSTGPTYAANGTTATPLVKKSTTTGSNTEPRYTYPRAVKNWEDISEEDKDSVFLAHEHYGLLYNWAAASGRIDDPSGNDADGLGNKKPTTTYRGVCPEGWHLPSDYEWSELEQEIARNPSDYSSQTDEYLGWESYLFFPANWSTAWRPGDANGQLDTYWGRQMRSAECVGTTIDTNGTSVPHAKGGFDALIVGYAYDNGNVNGYGANAVFWSSSSQSSSGVYRDLYRAYMGVLRNITPRNYLLSVRCKKDSQ